MIFSIYIGPWDVHASRNKLIEVDAKIVVGYVHNYATYYQNSIITSINLEVLLQF